MIHTMGLQKRYFDAICAGRKKIECRLNDSKRQLVRLGDTIDFTYVNEKGRNFVCTKKVIGLLHYPTFKELIADFDIDALTGGGLTPEEFEAIMLSFYPIEKQLRMGVVGIRLAEGTDESNL